MLHFWTATLCIPETCVDFYVLPATDMMQMGLSLMLSLFRISLRASSSRKNLCVSLSSSIFTICTAFPMIMLVRISEISKVRQRSIHSFDTFENNRQAPCKRCHIGPIRKGSQFPVFALQRTSASYFYLNLQMWVLQSKLITFSWSAQKQWSATQILPFAVGC